MVGWVFACHQTGGYNNERNRLDRQAHQGPNGVGSSLREGVMVKKSGLLFFLIGLAACAKVDIDPASTPALKEGRSVEVGRDAEATVGSVAYSEYNY